MSIESDSDFLETFPTWLRSLGDDAGAMADALSAPLPDGARRALASGLNYVFKSVDLIPDGIDDIGYLDDAFVLRVACAQVVAAGEGEVPARVAELGGEAAAVKAFLGADYARLDTYVQNLRRTAARGRAVDDILGDEAVRAEFVADVKGFAREYATPSFSREPKNLIKLRAFFDAKLPR
ncbi:MAG: YkvA family protein [Polyangiales bacterium]